MGASQCKFEPSMLVDLNDDEELRKMFGFNDMHCRVYLSLNTEVEVLTKFISMRRYINLQLTFIPAL